MVSPGAFEPPNDTDTELAPGVAAPGALWTRTGTPPVSVTVAPLPLDAGLSVPEIEYVWLGEVAVKLTPVTFAPFTVTLWLEGVKVIPELLGVTV